MSQNVNVNLVPGNYPKEFHVSQYDVGRQLVAKVVDSTGDYSIPSGATVVLVGTKPSGFGFTLNGTVSGSTVTFSTTATVTAEYGRIPCEIRITNGSTILGTANCMLVVEMSPHQEGVIDGNSETVIPELTILVERVEAAASNVLDMQVEADTLPAGSSATYSYDEETNTATFGIPQGEAGAGAAGVVAPAYSASSTYAVGDYVIHDGNLYRCTTAITTAEAFTAAHWTQVVLGDDVSNLKSDLNQASRFSLLNFECERGNYNNSGAKENSTAIGKVRLRSSIAIPVLKGDSITCTSYARYGIVFTDSNLSSYTATSGWKTSADMWVAPSDGYAKVTCLKNDYSEILDSEIDTLRGAVYGYLQCVPRVGFDNIEVMEDEILLGQNGYQFFDSSIFQVGGLTNGAITNVTSRIVTTNIVSFNRNVIVKADSGWRFGVQTYDANDNYLKDSSWQTKYKITAGTRFRICISKNPDYSINVTGLEKAVSKHVQYSSSVGELVINNEPFDYYYDGEPLDFSRKGFDITTLAPIPTITGKSIQGCAIYGGVLFQLYNTNTLRLIDTSNYSVIAELEITSDHGNTMDFSNEFYDVDDEFPLAYITSDSISNPTKVYVVRITRTGTTLIRTYYFGDASIKGYWAGHCLDAETNTLYLVGYTEDHYYLDEHGTNNMIVSAWDIDNTTVNQDSTLTPQFIKSFTVPFIRTGQGRRFFNNRIYILSSHNGVLSLPTNTNIVVIDPFREKIVSKFDNFPNTIKDREAEGIEFVLNGAQDGYDMILSDGNYYRLSFKKL